MRKMVIVIILLFIVGCIPSANEHGPCIFNANMTINGNDFYFTRYLLSFNNESPEGIGVRLLSDDMTVYLGVYNTDPGTYFVHDSNSDDNHGYFNMSGHSPNDTSIHYMQQSITTSTDSNYIRMTHCTPLYTAGNFHVYVHQIEGSTITGIQLATGSFSFDAQ